eukprot:316269-Pelagomonas_calceolata.AAC.1
MDNLLQKWILNVLQNLLGVKFTSTSGAFNENVALNFFSSFGFVPLCASTTRFLSATVFFSKRFSMLTSALAP